MTNSKKSGSAKLCKKKEALENFRLVQFGQVWEETVVEGGTKKVLVGCYETQKVCFLHLIQFQSKIDCCEHETVTVSTAHNADALYYGKFYLNYVS